MDSTENIKLFNSSPDDVVMPHISEEATEESKALISDDIDDAILGDNVKTLIIPEDTEIAKFNYVFDFTNIGTITVMQKQSIKSLISEYGDVQLYLYNDKKGLMAFGMGDKYILEKLVPIIKKHVFDDSIKVYKDFQPGKQLEEVNSRDITKMRLNL